MAYKLDENDLSKFIMVGDRILLKPKANQSRTKSGLYLPPNVQEKEKIHSGYVPSSLPAKTASMASFCVKPFLV